MADHIELCRNVWFATLKVPADLRPQLGRTKFKQTLQTTDRRRAVELAKPVVALWKAQLRQLQGEPGAVKTEALRWRATLEELKKAGDHDTAEAMEMLVTDKAEEVEQEKGTAEAQAFASLALGYSTPSTLHYDAWVASIQYLVPKARDQYKADVRRLVDRFDTLEAMTPGALAQWAEQLKANPKAPVSPGSLKRMVSCWRSYWRYLQADKVKAVPKGVDPFAEIELPSKKAKGKRAQREQQDHWLPFDPAAVPKLAQAAKDKGDDKLADLIALGAYTGARIEELCSLKWRDVKADSFSIVDSKTHAGLREVPLHPALQPLMKALKEEATDDYVIGGLTFNKYDDRSNAIGKRFGRLKAAMGHGPLFVFHSLRKTLVTLLEDAGVSENLAADIVGHEKPRITYGLYSGGATLKTKAEAIRRVRYPAKVGRAAEW
ncbi:tyrosine-type recombinase/integrase [Rubrivivax gelatinosus]|uniref:Phage integrase family protein n=1 Tax=Rubrivivax gelatinosus (strain NBRC 100245 / IL144) TaxID=983917 RepID=I0HT37_RUBGI|nr:tyrosine-type recombinase/integrase [Rubrivivax gelatinosus]BAL96174.1 phage integrase family protein [Rubrivivax gelatinosus IL144]